MTPPRGPDSLPGRISERRLRPPPAGESANDNKTAFIKSLDTGFSFGVEDREILFYRVKPLLPERRWARNAAATMEGTEFKGSKTR
jgi:hypothetical protein